MAICLSRNYVSNACRHLIFHFSAFSIIFFNFLLNSFLGKRTLRSQPRHLILMSAPIRMILHLFLPQGCCFFISTISFKPYCLASIFSPPFINLHSCYLANKRLFLGMEFLFLCYIALYG